MSMDSRVNTRDERGSELSIWGTQKKTQIGGMTVIGRKDQFGGPVAYVAERPEFIVKAVNMHDFLMNVAWDYLSLIRSDYEGRDGSIGGGMGSEYHSIKEALEKARG